jgi:hypothetical protein
MRIYKQVCSLSLSLCCLFKIQNIKEEKYRVNMPTYTQYALASAKVIFQNTHKLQNHCYNNNNNKNNKNKLIELQKLTYSRFPADYVGPKANVIQRHVQTTVS